MLQKHQINYLKSNLTCNKFKFITFLFIHSFIQTKIISRSLSKFSVPELKSKPYLERRETLGWSTLEERSSRGDLIQHFWSARVYHYLETQVSHSIYTTTTTLTTKINFNKY
ncbi:hypothetical protein BpHYR1_009741 [Brachionus plicatilis]|uniref:Uncharacterized protein n=1 Tax=Brachionus plicatilis TaxID=10195 RepID=A0A3M7R0A7_BRAPC|nr:hypothetical protein BpHYR1_009741 [Brachionus plicatilis]